MSELIKDETTQDSPEEKPNLAVKAMFRDWVNGLPDGAILYVPMLDQPPLIQKIMKQEAVQWFEVAEPVLYRYILKEIGKRIGGKALFIAAVDTVPIGKYLVMAEQYVSAQYEGQEYDLWLSPKEAKTGIEIYNKIPKVPEDEFDLENSRLVPLLSQEDHDFLVDCLLIYRNFKFMPGQVERAKPKVELLAPLKSLYALPAERTIRELRRVAKLNANGSLEPLDRGRGPLRRTLTQLKVKVLRMACREQVRLGREVQMRLAVKKIKVGNRTVTGEKIVEERIKPRLAEVLQPENRLFAAIKWGVLLERVSEKQFKAPDNDVLLAEKMLTSEQMSQVCDNKRHYGRNISNDPKLRAPYAENRLFEIARRAKARAVRVEKPIEDYVAELIRERYPQGGEPRLYVLGHKTGNLYPVRFLRYVGHLRPQFRLNTKKWRDTTDRLVMASIEKGLPIFSREADPFTEHGYEYINDWENKRILCYEDELVTVSKDRIVPAELHRFEEVTYA
jgi:hypothetical protein